MEDKTKLTPSGAKTPITICYGDGIGPEIMDAVLRILDAADAVIEPQEIQIGEKVYLEGHTSGIRPEAWDTLRNNKVFLKAPITTPQGGGYKSLNVTIRKTLGLYANVRPIISYHPFVQTHHPDLDMVIVRENEEDTYAGIEHRQTDEVYQCLKLISRPGCERIVRYAFEYAKSHGRKKVTCMTKDNIMKITDGLFRKVFTEIGKEYPEIEQDHHIIDIGSALIADQPQLFDVIVTLNLYGDIISDIAAQISGSVGLAGSANIGENIAMFEAIHGSAPDIAGRDIANPTALLKAAVQMLLHIGQPNAAEKIQNAWRATIEAGYATGDFYREGNSKKRLGTKDFAQAVIDHLGEKPKFLPSVDYSQTAKEPFHAPALKQTVSKKELMGVDLFIHWNDSDRDSNVLGKQLEAVATEKLKLKMITNRGVKVYPDGHPETFCTDHWRCRFTTGSEVKPLSNSDIIALLQNVDQSGLDVVKTENLYAFDGERAYSLGQGE
jgi:isocitrate dehydrogenase